jgi:hypothetical protein
LCRLAALSFALLPLQDILTFLETSSLDIGQP